MRDRCRPSQHGPRLSRGRLRPARGSCRRHGEDQGRFAQPVGFHVVGRPSQRLSIKRQDDLVTLRLCQQLLEVGALPRHRDVSGRGRLAVGRASDVENQLDRLLFRSENGLDVRPWNGRRETIAEIGSRHERCSCGYLLHTPAPFSLGHLMAPLSVLLTEYLPAIFPHPCSTFNKPAGPAAASTIGL